MEALKRVGRLVGHLVFWGWNVLFLALVVFGLGPAVLFELFVAAAIGRVPLQFALTGLALALLPAAGLLVGLFRLRDDPGRLLSLLYGVQFPLMLACLLRLFAIQVLTPATALGLAALVVGALGLLRTILVGWTERTIPGQAARLVAQSVYLGVGLWCAALAAVYGLPVAAWTAWGVARIDPIELLSVSPVALITGSLFVGWLAVTTAVLLLFPIAGVGIALRSWQLVARATAGRIGLPATAAIAAFTLVALGGGIRAASVQHQARAFALLDRATTDVGRREAIALSARIRAGLLEARLADERWLRGDLVRTGLERLWDDAGPASAVPVAFGTALLSPFSYRPATLVPWEESQEASRRYGAFFDVPIEVAERPTLLAAARSTWSWESAEAGLLEVGERKVHLAAQDVAVEPHGDVARVTVHDVYRNRTWDRQEVLVHFSLPEAAAVTGLWLGTEPDREHAFRFVVAPRGAAQEVYQREVRVRRDPALVEQVGPRQYRLRAFPVEPRQGRAGDVASITSEGPDLHLWLEVVVPVDEEPDGAPFFPLPIATEVRNLYWDADTVRTLDGAAAAVDGWLPDRVAAPGATRTAHAVRVGDRLVTAVPAGPLPGRVPGRLAVLVDGTRSMEPHREAVARALERLRAVAEVDVLCTIEQELARCPGFDAGEALFYGAVALERRLVEAARLAGDARALVVLTDAGSYELAAEAERTGLADVALPPLWLVHLGGFPKAYPDWTLDRVQRTGGGVVADVEELLVRMADPEVVDGWRWSIAPAGDTVAPDAAFAALAAGRAVASLDRHGAGSLRDLDALHAIAVGSGIVTVYSSMLVLVEERQREALRRAEADPDRFEREIIDAAIPEVSAVPEPTTWALLGIGGLLAAGARRLRSRSA